MEPFGKGLLVGEAVKGDVELNSRKVLAVKLQPAGLGKVLGIEDPFPVLIAVAASADEQFSHGAIYLVETLPQRSKQCHCMRRFLLTFRCLKIYTLDQRITGQGATFGFGTG